MKFALLGLMHSCAIKSAEDPGARATHRPFRLRLYVSDFPIRPPLPLSTRCLLLSKFSRG
jgi:hypothetical protein